MTAHTASTILTSRLIMLTSQVTVATVRVAIKPAVYKPTFM
jgi:hypothetical protein